MLYCICVISRTLCEHFFEFDIRTYTLALWPKSKEGTGRASAPGGARRALWGRAVAPLRARRAKGVARSRPLARVFSSTADFWRVAPRPVGPSFANKSCSIAAAAFFLILGRNNSNSASACNGVRSMSRALAVFQNCNSYWRYYCICNCCGALQPHVLFVFAVQ